MLASPREASNLWSRLERRDAGGGVDALVDPTACRRYVEAVHVRRRARIDAEEQQPRR